MEAAVVPDGLAELPAGAELGAALHAFSLHSVPNDRMLDVLRAQYRQVAHEQARMAATLVELGRCDGVPAPAVVSRSERPDELAVHETRAALRWTRRAADAEHGLSEAVVAVPELFAAWDAGAIDRPRVVVFDRYLTGLTDEQTAAVCARAVPRAPRLTTGQLDALLRRLVIEVDPDAAARWYRRGVRERTVHAYLALDGTVTMSATGLPPDEAEAACRRVEALAARVKRSGHPGRVGQIRTDVYLGLLDGRFHGLTDDDIVAALLASPRRPEDTADLVTTGTGDSHADSEHVPAGRGTDAADQADAADPSDTADVGTTSAAATRDAAQVGGTAAEGTPRAETAPETVASSTDAEPVGATTAAHDRSGAARTTLQPRRGIEIRAALSTLLDLDDRPGEIPGLGPVLAAQVRARVAMQTSAHWRFAVVDADGHLVSEGCLRRRPAGAIRDGPPGGIVEIQIDVDLLTRLAEEPHEAGTWAAVVAEVAVKHGRYAWDVADLDARADDRFASGPLRRHTEIRDRTCSFAGVCRRPAHASAQDHGHEHAAGGATVRGNVGPVCGMDHLVKHRGGWEVSRPGADGTVVWRSPLGGEYAATGEFLTAPVTGPLPGPAPPPGVEPPEDRPILRRPPRAGGQADRDGTVRPPEPTDDPPAF